LYCRLLKFLDINSILIPNQYGFRPNKSTTHALLDVVFQAYDNINKNFTGLILLDLTKTFDTMCHYNLLLKLEHYGIKGNVLNLITTYL